MKAKFPGHCPICGTDFKVGTSITRSPYDEWVHTRCQSKEETREVGRPYNPTRSYKDSGHRRKTKRV